MAVTGFWPVFKNLKATLDYADNPDKTTAPEYLDEDLYAALRYAENDDKTDRKMFVGGINCSAQNAYAEMIAVQRRFGLRGKVVGYHGIQSFREGEVTPEQAFAIGKETARRMWGERYQVLVTVHLNTDNIHCHFVVNPVSFKDGAKFKNKIGDHKELRKISDEICREHELSVLENSDFYSKGKKKEYWVHKAGKQTHRDMLRRDVEEALAKCGSCKVLKKEKKYVDAMQMLMLSYLFNSKWNNTFRDTAFVKDATPIANKLKWDSEKIDILAQIISDQVKRKNYDEGALIKSFQKALSQFGL